VSPVPPHGSVLLLFYNGNTFALIVALIIRTMNLPPDQAVIVRSLAGHIVAGVASEEEETAFRAFCETLG